MTEAAHLAFQEQCDDEQREAIGRGIATLILFSRLWIHRHVEQVEFVDRTTLRRQSSIDYSLPTAAAVAEQQALLGVVPLARLRKRKLPNFSVWDESSCRLPVLSATENAWLSSLALVSVARRYATEQNLGPLPESIVSDLRLVTELPAHGSGGAPGAYEIADRLIEGDGPDGSYAKSLFESDLLSGSVREFAEQFYLYVPHRSKDGERHVIKFSYEQILDHNPRGEAHGSGELIKAWLQSRLRKVLVPMGWSPWEIWLDAVAIGDSHSYHLEIVAPPQLQAVTGDLVSRSSRGASRDVDNENLRRVHMKECGSPRDGVGIGHIALRADHFGILQAAWLLALVMSILFFIGRDEVAALLENKSASLLLAIPSLVGAYLASPGEHAMAQRALLGTRSLVIVVALCSFIGAAVLQLGYSACEVEYVWRALSFVCLASLGLLTVSLLTRAGQTLGRKRRAGAAR